MKTTSTLTTAAIMNIHLVELNSSVVVKETSLSHNLASRADHLHEGRLSRFRNLGSEQSYFIEVFRLVRDGISQEPPLKQTKLI